MTLSCVFVRHYWGRARAVEDNASLGKGGFLVEVQVQVVARTISRTTARPH